MMTQENKKCTHPIPNVSFFPANAVAISILMTSKKLESIFNFILICNLMLHSLYLASSIATEIYKVFGQSSYTAHVIFASFLLAFKVRK